MQVPRDKWVERGVMSNREYDYDDSFNCIETDLTTDLFNRLVLLFKDPKYCKEVNGEDLQMTLIESDGKICVLQNDWNFYPLGVSYDTVILETVVERFNLDPCYSAEFDSKSSMAFIKLHSGYGLQEELIDLYEEEGESNDLGLGM